MVNDSTVLRDTAHIIVGACCLREHVTCVNVKIVAIELTLRKSAQLRLLRRGHVELTKALVQAIASIASVHAVTGGHGALEGLVAPTGAHGNLRCAHHFLAVAVVSVIVV
jgi:hypothetical protein